MYSYYWKGQRRTTWQHLLFVTDADREFDIAHIVSFRLWRAFKTTITYIASRVKSSLQYDSCCDRQVNIENTLAKHLKQENVYAGRPEFY